MKRVVVTAPDGTRWDVRVAWEPRWRAFARRLGGWRRRKSDVVGWRAALRRRDEVAEALRSGTHPVGEPASRWTPA